MAGNLPELSKGEWLIMKACWEKGKATAREIHEKTLAQRKWEYQTAGCRDWSSNPVVRALVRSRTTCAMADR